MAGPPTNTRASFTYTTLHDFTSASSQTDKATQIVHGAWEIRLLRLHPGVTTNSPIHCDLTHATFSDVKRRYEALSYVWADGVGIHDDIPAPCEITVNSIPFPVTPNLYGALQRLRGRASDPDRVLWIDQICINQNDTAEKNWQVDRMTLIYGYAKQTTIWLGGDADGSFRALFLVSGLAAVARLATREERVAAAVDRYADQARWDALGKLMERKWWFRTWTVQECVLPRLGSLAVRCGVKEIPWTDFISAVRLMDELRQVLPLCVGTVSVSSVLELQVGRRRAAARGEEKGDGDGLDTLLQALARYRRRLATDPRDKIYAIMRMARDFRDASEEGRRLLRVDYDKPAEEVYTDVAKFFVDFGKTLEFLGHCRLTKNLASLPSWVPDWSDTNASPAPFHTSRDLTVGYDQPSNFHVSGTSLVLHGNRMGRVDALGDPCLEQDVSPTGSNLFAAWRGIFSSQRFTDSASKEVEDEEFVRVLVANRGPRKEALDREAMRDFVGTYRRWFVNTEPVKGELATPEAMKLVEYLASVRRACVNRRIFVSGTGFLGLAPQETADGDLIVFSSAAGLSLVLRPCSTLEYTFVGTCFILEGTRSPCPSKTDSFTLI